MNSVGKSDKVQVWMCIFLNKRWVVGRLTEPCITRFWMVLIVPSAPSNVDVNGRIVSLSTLACVVTGQHNCIYFFFLEKYLFEFYVSLQLSGYWIDRSVGVEISVWRSLILALVGYCGNLCFVHLLITDLSAQESFIKTQRLFLTDVRQIGIFVHHECLGLCFLCLITPGTNQLFHQYWF